MMAFPSRRLCALVLAFCLLPLSHSAGAERVSVSAELERLAAAHGFSVRGREHTADAIGRADSPELFPRLRRLLEEFDHVIVQGAAGGVERVIILGEKTQAVPVQTAVGGQAAPGGELVLESIRRGTQHAVQASIEDARGGRVPQVLVVDTGADYVVLPLSVAGQAGLDPDTLGTREMQTANGTVSARMGRLPALWLGETRLEGVEAAFIEDDRIAGTALLGMSVLARYRVTIDDEHNQITLSAR